MTSQIDPEIIVDNERVHKSDLREQLQIAKDEISALQQRNSPAREMAFGDELFAEDDFANALRRNNNLSDVSSPGLSLLNLGGAVTVSTFADLRNLSSGPTFAFVAHRTTFGDKGGGGFEVDPLDNTTPDDGAMIIVDASGRRWKRVYIGDFWVEWFGAKGDGIEDDQPAVVAATNAAIAAGGGCIRFQAKRYRFASKWSIVGSKISVKGASGKDASVLVGDFDGDDIISFGDGSTSINFCAISDLRVDGGTTPRTSGAGIAVRNVHDMLVSNIHFGLNHATCISLEGGSDAFIYKVYDCELSAGAYGIDLGVKGGIVQDCHISRNTIASMTAAGVRAVHLSGGYFGFNSVFSCFRGFITAPGNGQYVTACKFEQCLADGCDSDGWFFNTAHANGSVTDITMVNCWGASNGQVDNHHGLWIAPSTGTISGMNIVAFRAEGNNGSGMVLDGGTEIVFDNCQVFCNSMAGSGLAHGLAINVDVSRFKISGGWYGKGGRIGFVTGTNNQGFGIIVNAGASDYYSIIGVTVLDNVTGNLVDAGTGVNKVVQNNLS